MGVVLRGAGLLMLAAALSGCSLIQPGPAQVVSVSDDGRYVVSSHDNRRLILWDTEERQRSVVSRNANIYSAHFVSGRDDTFLWQDLDDVVHVQTVDGEVLESFEHFPTYGHVMGSDLKTYFASDAEFHIYQGWGTDKEPVKVDGQGARFQGTLLNLVLDESGEQLLSVGHAGVFEEDAVDKRDPLEATRTGYFNGPTLWDAGSLKPRYSFPGLFGKAHGDISPDGQYVIAAGENRWGFMWETDTGERRWQLANYWYGKPRRDVDVPEGKERRDLPAEERLKLDRLIDIPEGGREGEEGHMRGAQVGAL
ncbi:WD40 repeat domain-containing protein, partial [Aquisalimonas asiatica]